MIETARLRFRSWREDDLPLAERLWGDAEVTRFIGAIDPATRLAKEIETERAHGIQYWPMFSKVDGDFVGCAGLRPYEDGIPEFGVHVVRAHWRKGLAAEAARAVIRHAFDRGAKAIFAGHNPNNAASRKMLSALGFRYTHDELYPPTGLMHPSYAMDVDVRPVRESDVPAVVELVREVLSEFGLKFGEGAKTDDELLRLPSSYDGGQFWVAARGNEILGTAGVFPVAEGTFELRKMCLRPASRGLGLGKRLLDEAVRWTRANGGKRIVLDTTHQMTRAIAFYEANGFVRDDKEIRGSRCSRGYARDL